MTPQSVGRTESNLVIGKHSGRNAVRNKFESMATSWTTSSSTGL